MPATAISEEVLDILRNGIEIDGQIVRITAQLERPLYVKVNEALESIGGKWNRSKKGHVYPEGKDPAVLIAELSENEKMPPKNPLGYFPTPADIVQKMLEKAAELMPQFPDCRILEPSAGEGAILEGLTQLIGDLGFEEAIVEMVEFDPFRCDILKRKGYHNVVGRDFLTMRPQAVPNPWFGSNEFDVVLMNPPFAMEGRALAYIDHIEHAKLWVRKGGCVVAIAAGGFEFHTDKRTTAFRKLVEEHGGWEKLEDKAFQESGTGVSTVMLWFRV